ncbi:serine/threonine kinase PKN8 [Plesiocystis pacifica SIR-1]|uniref:Serine/threonine kinase PKN8 n=1 Tax=Plesiocystis pacifica SIR-1 TaxID=391625 RepID=A6GIM3_9BACT|nr:serine/threonine-protein kinase [Plesiocystis pacifica]EDM74272.1 serine/threonine kinase PKN8 [Plesiocystis pacifica SIR-1]
MDGPADVTCLDEGGEDDVDVVDEDVAPTSTWLERGASIDRYRVLECLGVGGMGVIYSAWDPDLDRKLAIKLARRSRSTQKATTRGRARLIREAQALARLRHPNVVAVHDVGIHDERVFVAMEYVEGETLTQWLAQTAERDYDRLMSIFLQVGRGLAAAHRAGLVHRDVKPDNIMLGKDRRVLVLDFGIARELTPGEDSQIDFDEDDDEALEALALAQAQSEFGDATDVDEFELPSSSRASLSGVFAGNLTPLADLTRAGAVIGTPAYMAPEQHRRKVVTSRSDQFAFCVAMWEALNGERPFGGGNREKLLARMRLGQFRPFRRADVPRRVVMALRRGLSWNPSDRFPTMESLLEVLNPRPRGRRVPMRHAALAGAGLCLVGVLGTLGAVYLGAHVADPAHLTCDQADEAMARTWTGARRAELGEALRPTLIHDDVAGPLAWANLRDALEAWSRRWRDARRGLCYERAAVEAGELPGEGVEYDRWVACLDQQRRAFDQTLDRLIRDPEAPPGPFTIVATLPDPEDCGALAR